jgi:hypothetical protein
MVLIEEIDTDEKYEKTKDPVRTKPPRPPSKYYFRHIKRHSKVMKELMRCKRELYESLLSMTKYNIDVDPLMKHISKLFLGIIRSETIEYREERRDQIRRNKRIGIKPVDTFLNFRL